MRSTTRAHFPALAIVIVGLVSLAFPLPALSDEYRLLELDGYKVKWGTPQLGSGARVSYAFANENLQFDEARNCGQLAPIEALFGERLSMETIAQETASAFEVWERAAGLSFHEVKNAQDADIVLGAQGQPRRRAFANVSYASESQDDVRSIDKALVCLNPEQKWKVGFDGDEDIYDIRYTLIHEIGHTLGLDHPGPSGQIMGFRYTEAFNGLQSGDLQGIQELYGRTVEAEIGTATYLAEKTTE